MKRAFIITTALLLAAGLILPSVCQARSITPNNIYLTLNSARTKYRLVKLRRSAKLDLAARTRAKILLKSAILNHGTSTTNVKTILRQVGYRASLSGELLAADFTSAEDTVYAWSYSITHRRIMYDARYRDIGIAVINNPQQRPMKQIVVVILGRSSSL